MRTYSAKPTEVNRKWFVVDATDMVLGRLAAEVSKILRGKNKPIYTTNIDVGDNVVIINAEKVILTGKKLEQHTYYWHTGYPGGIKEINAKKTLEGRFPERLIERAIRTMVPRNPLGRQQLSKLHVYAGSEHPHIAQKPELLDIGSYNVKNKKRGNK